MSVYSSDVRHIGDGLNNVAKAIESLAKRPVYNIIVNTGADQDTIAKAIADAVERLDKRASESES